MTSQRFFYCILAGIGFVLLGLSLFNGTVDHSRLFGVRDINGFNQYKPYFFAGQFVSKPYAVRRLKPDGIILGTSRAGASLQPSHIAWDDYRAYNFALAGTTAEIQWWNFRHAVEVSNVKRAVLGLDFMMFNSCRDQGSEPHFREYRQRVAGDGIDWRYPVRYLIDHLGQLSSVQSTRLSWLTMRAQEQFKKAENGHLHLHANGYWQRYPGPEENHYQGFRVTERNYLRETWYPQPNDCYALAADDTKVQLEYLRNLMELAHAEDVELHVYFSPFHARFAELMAAAGLWSIFEELKAETVALNEVTAKRAGAKPFPLWDFSGYNAVNTEEIPAPEDRQTRMRYYVDGTHSTSNTGDLVQDVLFGITGVDRSPVAGFGRRLSSDNLSEELAAIRAQQDQYRSRHAAQFRELLGTAGKFGRG